MTWSIWKCPNAWIFENQEPTVQQYKIEFTKKLLLLIHRARRKYGIQSPTGSISGSPSPVAPPLFFPTLRF